MQNYVKRPERLLKKRLHMITCIYSPKRLLVSNKFQERVYLLFKNKVNNIRAVGSGQIRECLHVLLYFWPPHIAREYHKEGRVTGNTTYCKGRLGSGCTYNGDLL